MLTKFKNIKIKGISSVVPVNELSLLDDKNLYNGNEKKIQRVINSSGFLKRRITDKNTTASDLCLAAANDLIDKLNIEKDTIDALIFVSYTPDYLMPATSYVLHKKLNLSQNCIVMDIPQACSGYILGLFQAGMLLNSGCKRVLLLVGDTFSKYSDMFINHTAPVFGDAGSATIIDYDENSDTSYFSINSDGNGYDALICKNGGFRNIPQKEKFYTDDNYKYESIMDGGRIFDFTMEKIAPDIEKILEFSGNKIENIDNVLFHQANKFIIENIAERLNIPDNKYTTKTLTEYGNQCGASIPCSVCYTLKNIVNSNKIKCLLSGFGVGLSWASAIINIDNIYCSDLTEYSKKV